MGKEANPNKLRSTSTRSNADQCPRRRATMLIKCHLYPVVFRLRGKNAAIIQKNVARMYQSNIATKYHIRLKRWNALMVATQLVDTVVMNLVDIDRLNVACYLPEIDK